jgi:putative aldouronate transport system permease protein
MSLTAGNRPDGTRPPAAVGEPTAAVTAATVKESVPRRGAQGGQRSPPGPVAP